jgi:hypothetical protein
VKRNLVPLLGLYSRFKQVCTGSPCEAELRLRSHLPAIKIDTMQKSAIVLILLFISIKVGSQSESDKKVHFILSLPYINGFNIQGDDTTRTNWGFLGVSAGLDYGDSTKTWCLRVGACTDFFAPIGPADIEGIYSSSYGVYANLTRKRITNLKLLINVKRIEFAYGINFTHYTWRKTDTFSDPSTLVKTSNNSLGLTGYFNYFIGRRFYIGYIYQPALVMIDENVCFHYQHLMSFDFGFRF